MITHIIINKNYIWILLIFGMLLSSCRNGNEALKDKNSLSWKAQWITTQDQSDSVNAWVNFRKEIELKQTPESPLVARISVDSKYWLWINGEMIIREGGLKRGPTPDDTYYDEVDLTNHLKVGKNVIAVLLHYFGKDGFSHNSSEQSGLVFDLQSDKIEILSDSSWKAWLHRSFGETGAPFPNYRLPESNKHFDARKGDFSFVDMNFDAKNFPDAVEMGIPPVAPWNNLIKRPIPQWKDFGLESYENDFQFPFVSSGDTIIAKLPYNAQITPYLKIDAKPGQLIDIRTDQYYGGGAPNIRTEYITKKGTQNFEDFGWISGQEVHYYIPEGIKILDLKYRETGYDTEFVGSFDCNDPFFNSLWKKALRTLYITMRDTYMDCPDRERAQWWGDVVLESGESFYALDRSADALTKKGIMELMNWQREDGTIFSPVPSGNWNKELPGQMLSSVGYYGFYNYYLHSGDIETIRLVYEPVKKYLNTWNLKTNGTLKIRQSGWLWGDWGKNKDIPLLINTQYHLAQKGLLKMAEALGKQDEVKRLRNEMTSFKIAFNKNFWKGDHYRSADYVGKKDDRSQALAVVSGIADPDKFNAIYKVLKTERHASPYMEKYVIEALFQMGFPDFALQRLKERFFKMVNHPSITTLWEGWGIGKEGYGGGTINHAWSGGGLTLLSQYVAGVAPIEAGYETFQVKPQTGKLREVKAVVPSIKGDIYVKIIEDEVCTLNLIVPSETTALVYIPKKYESIHLNHKSVIEKGEIPNDVEVSDDFYIFKLKGGDYRFIAK